MSLYDDASLIMFPSGYKEDKIYSLKPTDGSGDLTFTRASTATRVNADGLIEGVRTNLQIYSEDFRNIAEGGATNTWTPNDTVILSTNNEAPDGTLTATRIRGTSGGNKARQAVIFGTSGLSYTGSFFIRRLSGTGTIQLRVGDVGTTSTINPTSTWQRFDHTVSPTTTTIRLALVLSNDTDEFEIWGAQLEVSDFGATEYIPTTTTAVSVGMLADVPRIDYTGGGCGKLLLEPQRTNLALYSEQFDNAAWTKVNLTIASNNTTSPDGTINADKLSESSSGTNFRVALFLLSSTSATNYNYSAFLKQGSLRYGGVRAIVNEGTNRIFVNVDLQEGIVTSTNTVGTGVTWTYGVEDYGSGWYRVWVSGANTSGDVYITIALSNSATPSYLSALPNYNGTGSDYIYAWGAQLEAGSYVSSYIPTLASSVTRLADAASLGNLYTNNLITDAGGTWFFELDNNLSLIRDASSNFFIGTTNNGFTNTSLGIRTNGATAQRLSVYKRLSGSLTQLELTLTDTIKVAIKWNGTSANVFINGVKVVTDTAFTDTNMEFFNGSAQDVSKNLKSTMLFPTPLTDTQCIELTTI